MTWSAGIGLLILAMVLVALFRGNEVRLVLLVAAFALAALASKSEIIVITLFQGLADASSIIPICSAMGFAYVLKAFRCDQHLVRALTIPLMQVKWLMIPGTILIGFVVNITIISQTSTSLAVGTVLIPLLRSLGMRGVVIGSALLLGASLGGELLNPGAPELGTIATRLGIDSSDMVPKIAQVIFFHLAIAIGVFWWMNRKETQLNTVPTLDHQQPISWICAIVPIVPIVLLFLFGPPFNLFTFPTSWLVHATEAPSHYGPRLIGLSMLIGCLAACLAVPGKATGVARHYFEGAGYGYTNIISLIVIAKCFSEGIKLSGITDLIGHAADAVPVLLLPLAALLPCGLAFLSGSGIGATQGLYPMLADVAIEQQVDPTQAGVLCCLGSAAGRTMSLVAAVNIMCSNLTESKPADLCKRVAPPLLIGLIIIISWEMLAHALKG
ncbi:MAG: C4-dicarboxylate transporter DcuC [Planctomycetia bacterium]|nr:C4-dicarboxylate transporter DcuC [Planctomycetia bacterium]